MRGRSSLICLGASGVLVVAGAGLLLAVSSTAAALPGDPAPRAQCGPGSQPEHGLQGEVPLADRNSGRSQLGYWCNLVRVGQFQAEGAGWQNAWYDHCDYFDTKTAEDPSRAPNGNGNAQKTPGTQVIDVSDPAHPVRTANLDTPALDGPWESLKVNEKRGLLAGVGGFGSDGDGPLYFDVYDVSQDCAHPKQLASMPIDMPIGHEGNWATDGMTYYGTSLGTGTVAAIDVSNPSAPSLITVFKPDNVVHGVATSDDGKLLYVADIAGLTPDADGAANGLSIWDVSGIQARSPGFVPTELGHVYWTDGATAQHPLPISYNGKPYVLFVDEGGASSGPSGAARIIDVSNPAAPVIVSHLRLEIQEAANFTAMSNDTNGNGVFTDQAHYCYVDHLHDPTAAACGMFQSGIRVFDIRNPLAPREIAYYNPPAQVAKHGTLNGSEHDGGSTNGQPPNDTTDWCSSQIRFYDAPDGTHYLWAQCQDNGFMVLKFTNGAYPLSAPATSVQAATTAGAPLKVAAAAGGLPNTSVAKPLWVAIIASAVVAVEVLLLFVAVRRRAFG